jgi:crossover junction endodeoxyribonuclease RuvC
MLVLGIDPGIAITGYGLIQTDKRNEYQCVDYGVVTTKSGFPDAERLKILLMSCVKLLRATNRILAPLKNYSFKGT